MALHPGRGLVGLIARATVWCIALLVSMVAAAIILIAAAAIVIILWRVPDMFGFAVGGHVAGVVWPGLLTATLILCDRGLYVGPSRRLVWIAVAWSAPLVVLHVSFALLGFGPFALKNLMGAPAARVTFWTYVAPSLFAALLGCRSIKAEDSRQLQ